MLNPLDKFDKEKSKIISKGRAMNDKTNLITDMVVGIGMNKKYILYAFTASMIGSILGLLIGFSVFPIVIF